MLIKSFSIFSICMAWLICTAPNAAAGQPGAIQLGTGSFLLGQADDKPPAGNDAAGKGAPDAGDQADERAPGQGGVGQRMWARCSIPSSTG